MLLFCSTLTLAPAARNSFAGPAASSRPLYLALPRLPVEPAAWDEDEEDEDDELLDDEDDLDVEEDDEEIFDDEDEELDDEEELLEDEVEE